MIKTSKLLVSALTLILCFVSINFITAQMVGTNAYIKGTSVEIGIDGAGGFEGCPTGVSPPLPGMHFRSGNPYFGFVSNPQVNAWATFDGDFFTPGSPENGWGVEVGSATGIMASNNCSSSSANDINGTITSWSQTFTCISSDWQGDLTSGTNIHFKINYFLNLNDLFYTTTVSITNNTAATIPELYYYRNFDPDNNQPISGDFTTTNTIVSQPFSGACNTAHVKGTSVLPASQPMSYVGLAGTGANWRAYYGGFANRNASDLWNGIGFTQTVGSSMFADIAIGLAYRIQNLAPGATETIKFVVILDDLAAAQAVANTTYLTYPGSASAPPAACTPYTDTAKICQGVPATIGVAGPNIASYNWSWSPATGLSSSTGPSVSANPATTTTYTVTGTPINACFTAVSFPIVVYVTPSPTVVPEPNLTYCAGAVVPANTFASTPAGATFTWTNSNTGIGLAASGTGGLPSFTATNASGAPITSTITVTPSVAGSTCPGVPSTFTITINPTPIVTVNSPTICPGQTATLTAAGGTTYLWNTGSTANPLSVTPAITTTYTVTGTTSGCTGSAVATVTVGGSVPVTVNSPTICAGQTATLTGAGATTYLWSTGSTANPLSVTPATTTSYTVTGTTTGCTGSAVATVTVNPLPTVTAETNLTYCAGAAVPANTFASTPAGATFAWTNSNTAIGLVASGTGGTPAFTATNATGSPITSTITITPTLAGCTGPTSTFTITVNPLPVTTVNSPTICPTTTATLTAAGATTYLWSTGSTANPLSVTPASTTTYTVTGTSLGCTSTAVATVTVGGSITATVNSPTICAGQTATLTATGGTTYSWSTGSTANPISVSPATTTSYTVTANSGGCTGSAIATVTVNPLPVTTSTNSTICAGATTTLTAGGATSYLWSTGSTANPLSVTPGTTTSYTVTGTSLGCTSTAVGTVTVNPIPVTTSTSVTVCPGFAGTLTASGATTYLWSTGATTASITATPATTTSYTVTGTSLGCSSTAVGTITVAGALSVTVNSPTICNGVTANLTAGGATTYTWSAGATSTGTNTADATPATTTSYTVTGTTAGCTGTAVSTVTVNPIPVTTSTSTTVCAGTTATLTAGGATTYLWSTGSTANPLSITPGTTTSYTVTGTSLGCSSTAVGTVTVNPIPVTTSTSVTVCPGFAGTLNAGGATTYVWNTGATTAAMTATPATTTSYTVTGTSLGCSSTAVGTITVASALAVTVNSPTICNGVTANLTAGGATTYTWSAGATSTGTNTADASPATTTSYTVTGTTAGCTGTAVSTVTVNPIPVTTSTSTTICDGATATLTAGGATTYLWDTGSTANPLSVSPSTTTSYTVTGTSLGCSSTAVGTVTVNPIPVTTVNSPSICPASTANLIAGGATSYTWTAGATPTGVNTADASPASTTTYTVTGTSLGCSSTAVATVTVNSALVVNAGLNDSVCFGGSVVLGVTPNGAGYLYDWTPTASLVGATTANPTASPATTTTYSVTLTDPSGCTGTSTVTVFANPQITMAIAGIDVTCNGACNGQTIVIPSGGTPAYSYLWSSGCTGASCTSLCPGTYTVIVTDAWGCTATASTSFVEPTLLTASATTTPTSCNAACDGNATATGAGGTVGTGYTYSWSTTPVQTTATANGLCAGTYTCTITDANGCTATVTATITEPTLVVTAPIASATICFGGTTTLTASASGGNGGAYNYVWSPAGTGSTASVTVSPVGTTTYTVDATDVNGCPAAPVTVTVTVNPALSVVASGTASICPGASTSISALASFGTGGPYTYTWAPAGTGSGTPVSVSPAVTTTYTVTASDGCSPTATATVTVTVLPSPVVLISATATSGCEPLCLTLINNSTVAGGSIATWLWDYGDGSTPDTTHAHCYTSAGQYSVTLTVSSSLGGCTSTSTINNYITVHPNPVAAFTTPTSTSIINPTVSYTDNSTISSGTIVSWDWNFGDPFAATIDSTSTLQNPTHTFTEAGSYCATLTVTSNFGCVSTVQECLIIEPEFTFFIPNAFTPNGDGVNDEFYGKGDYVKDFEMMIFDRWGNLIFFSDDINKHWDGIANHGKEVAQQDVYVYTVKITDANDKKHKYTGTVTIVK